MTSVRVQQVSDKTRLFAWLNRERLYAAYAICDLEPHLFRHCQWAVAEENDWRAVGLLFSGLSQPILITLGDVAGVAAILERALRPAMAYFNCRAEHLPAVTRYYELKDRQEMWRMALTAETFRPRPWPAPPRRLGPADIAELNALYDLAQAEHFAAYQVEQGIFYGLYADGRLVATAGTHVLSPTYGIAAVGNVFTHPAYRGRGYATACTSAVVHELVQRGCRDVVLNVNIHNDIAGHVYERLGFQRHCRYVECVGKRRHQGLLARLLGRQYSMN